MNNSPKKNKTKNDNPTDIVSPNETKRSLAMPRLNLEPLLYFAFEVISLVLPLFLVPSPLIGDPDRVKAFISVLTAILGWSIFKLLAPNIHQAIRKNKEISWPKYLSLLITLAIGALLIVTSLQSIQAILGKEAILLALGGFALEGAATQWFRWGNIITALITFALGRTLLVMLLGLSISYIPISFLPVVISPYFFIAALAPAIFLSLHKGLISLIKVRKDLALGDKSKRFLTLFFVLPPTLLSLLCYIGALQPKYLFVFISLLPIYRYVEFVKRGDYISARSATSRAFLLFALVFLTVSVAM